MKVSQNFVLQEFIPKETWDKWGERAIMFLTREVIGLAQFYSQFFTIYFKKLHPNFERVEVIINNWHKGGSYHYRGYRPPNSYINGQFKSNPLSESQHRRGNAFDCDIIIVLKTGIRIEVPQSQLHQIIKDNWLEFKKAGLTRIEDLEDAPTWLHSDCAITNQDKLLVVKA